MEQNIQELWNNNKGEERQKGGEEIFKRIMIENCPKLIISAKPQIQEAQRTPGKIKLKKSTPRYSIFRLQKIKEKEKKKIFLRCRRKKPYL